MEKQLREKLSHKAKVNFVLQSGYRNASGVKRYTYEELMQLPTEELLKRHKWAIAGKWTESFRNSFKKK